MAGKRKKTRTHVPVEETQQGKAPKSFVIKSGPVGHSVSLLVKDVRKIMEPNTATKLRERKTNKLKDFVHVAAQFNVTHFMIFSQTKVGTNLRVARVPRGPTLTFRVQNYSLRSDVTSIQRHPKSPGSEYQTPPLLVLNNFKSPEKHVKLVATTFQNLFPAIDIQTLKLSEARRVVLINYNSETDSFDLRHYIIQVKVTGVSKSVKRIIHSSFPNLSSAGDISDFILGTSAKDGYSSAASESDVEEDAKIELPDKYLGRNNVKGNKRAIKLLETGPRLSLKLLKIEEGLCDGNVIYHSFVKKSAEDIKKLEKERQRKAMEKAKRRKEQEANVARKKAEKEKQKKAMVGLVKDETVKDSESDYDEEEYEDEDMAVDTMQDQDSDMMSEEEDMKGSEDSFSEEMQ